MTDQFSDKIYVATHNDIIRSLSYNIALNTQNQCKIFIIILTSIFLVAELNSDENSKCGRNFGQNWWFFTDEKWHFGQHGFSVTTHALFFAFSCAGGFCQVTVAVDQLCFRSSHRTSGCTAKNDACSTTKWLCLRWAVVLDSYENWFYDRLLCRSCIRCIIWRLFSTTVSSSNVSYIDIYVSWMPFRSLHFT